MLLKTIQGLFGTWDGIGFHLIEYSGIFFKNGLISQFGLAFHLLALQLCLFRYTGSCPALQNEFD
jgi:hypothetical protein